jgi:hypothetical protein
METIIVPIIVAIISGPIVVVINRLRKENTDQHAEARILLRQVIDRVDLVGTKIDNHIGWHDGQKDKDEA